MAQNLKHDRLDNRGGHKPTTSTKKLFIYRVERSMHEKLKAYAIELNKEVERGKEGLYTIVKTGYSIKAKSYFKIDMGLSLTISEGEEALNVLRASAFDKTKYTLIPLPIPCNTTEN